LNEWVRDVAESVLMRLFYHKLRPMDVFCDKIEAAAQGSVNASYVFVWEVIPSAYCRQAMHADNIHTKQLPTILFFHSTRTHRKYHESKTAKMS